MGLGSHHHALAAVSTGIRPGTHCIGGSWPVWRDAENLDSISGTSSPTKLLFRLRYPVPHHQRQRFQNFSGNGTLLGFQMYRRNPKIYWMIMWHYYYYYYYYYYWYSALGPVWPETRAQSGDWYGSCTLHPGQVLRDSRTPL